MGWVVNATPRPLYPRERPATHCTGGWVGPRAVLDGWGKSRPPPGFDPRTVQPVASRYTDWATRPTIYSIFRTLIICMECIKDQKMNFEFIGVFLLYYGQRHVSATHVTIFRGICLRTSIQLCYRLANVCGQPQQILLVLSAHATSSGNTDTPLVLNIIYLKLKIKCVKNITQNSMYIDTSANEWPC